MQELIGRYPGLDVRAGSVFDLVFDHSKEPLEDKRRWGKVIGVRLGKPKIRLFRIVIDRRRFGRSYRLLAGRHMHWNVSVW